MKKTKTAIQLLLLLCPLLLCVQCKRGEGSGATAARVEQQPAETTPFDPDSACHYVAKQVSFGPRVPGSPGHAACLDWMTGTLRAFGAAVTEQSFTATAHDGTRLPLTNVIASFRPEAPRRILLMAHWDTRPWADKDDNPSAHTQPIPGADDGGSGVGVLMEMARILGSRIEMQHIGIDLLFFDGEDYGTYSQEDSWCLGSVYWSKNPHTPGYAADMGILLDMVGGREAAFYWEYFSKSYAPQLLTRIWDKAHRMGYGDRFRQADGGALTDDHIPVIRNLGIPCVDIVNYDPAAKEGFAPYWHTLRDDMNNISVETLAAVGHTLTGLLIEIDEQMQ